MDKPFRSVESYSAAEVKVREATNNDPWGPTGTSMADVAQLTFDSSATVYQVLGMLGKRLNSRDWRHVYKALKVLDYLLHEGSDTVTDWSRKNIYTTSTLREFHYFESDGRDIGANVRIAAKNIYGLLTDEELLRAERRDGKTWRSRVTGIEEENFPTQSLDVLFPFTKPENLLPVYGRFTNDNLGLSPPRYVMGPSAVPYPQKSRFGTPRIEIQEQRLTAPSPMYENLLTPSNQVTQKPSPSPLSDISHGEDDIVKAITQSQRTHRNVKDHAHVSTREIPQIHPSMHAQPQESELQTRNTRRQNVGVWRESLGEDMDATTQDDYIANAQDSEPREQVMLEGSLPLHTAIPPPTPALPTWTTKQVSFISAEDQREYEDVFLTAMGSLTLRMPWLKVAETLRSEFTVSDNVIHEIRELCDTTVSGHLHFVEFALAMYYAVRSRIGKSLPATLPLRLKDEVDRHLSRSMSRSAGSGSETLASQADSELQHQERTSPPLRERQMSQNIGARVNQSDSDLGRSTPPSPSISASSVILSPTIIETPPVEVSMQQSLATRLNTYFPEGEDRKAKFHAHMLFCGLSEVSISEIEILKRLKHRHIVEFIGSYTDAKYIGLLMLPVANMDLAAYMENFLTADSSQSQSQSQPELRTFFGCLATGLEFLHEHNIRHKDIKPGNILVSNGNVLFTDFGLSLDFTDATGSTTMSMVNGMTPRYCAPEVARQEARNTMSDIWCLGVVFLEMVVTLKGQPIRYVDDFFKQQGSDYVYVRLNIDLIPELLAHIGSSGQTSANKALEWIREMLLEEQKARPTASTLVTWITTPIKEGESTGFCGICCVLTEEEDFSDYSND